MPPEFGRYDPLDTVIVPAQDAFCAALNTEERFTQPLKSVNPPVSSQVPGTF